MINLREYRSADQGIADRLNYALMAGNGVMLNKDGSLMAGWYFRGPDMESATNAELEALSARLNGALGRFGSGWMLHTDAVRRPAPGYPSKGAFPDKTTRLIDTERRAQFEAEDAHFESVFALFLTFMPPMEVEGRLVNMMFSGGPKNEGSADRYLKIFNEACSEFEAHASAIINIRRMCGQPYHNSTGRLAVADDMLTYLHYAVTGENHRVDLPSVAMYLDTVIGNVDFIGGLAPRAGNRHIRIIAIDNLPQSSAPGLLDALGALPIEYRWSSRFIALDPQEARSKLNSLRKKWQQQTRGFKDQLFRTASGTVDLDAIEMAGDAQQAMAAAQSGYVRFGYYTSVIILTGEDPGALELSVREVRKVLQNLGFGARLETINAMEAFLGSLPGHGVENIRAIPIHTLNLADLLPTTAVWAGPETNPCPFYPPNSPPLAYAATAGSTPFRLSAHVSDVGHMLILGPTGAGKTTLLCLLIAQHFRYPNAQVFAFDMKYGLYGLVKAAGGDHYDIGKNSTLGFMPLKEIDTREDFAWAADWIETLCTLQKMEITAAGRNMIFEALTKLKDSPSTKRTLTEFVLNVQDQGIRDALQPYTLGGAMSMLDSDHDTLGSSNFMVFEMEELWNMGDQNVIPVLLYLFRRIEKRLDGSPTVLSIDEAWMALGHPMFREKLRLWLKLLRSKNCGVWPATQSLSDIDKSPIRDVIFESCPTKILLPNAEASNQSSREFYQRMGLNEAQIDLIRYAIPKREYYIFSPEGRRKFQLALGGVAMSFVGVSGKSDIKAIEECIAKHGENWPAEWLRQRGLPEWADYWYQV